MVRALFPGSFDPVTLGHLDLVTRGLQVFDAVTVAVAENISKQAVFSLEERVALLEASLPDQANLAVCTFSGLVVDYCRRHDFGVIMRGMRSGSDFEYEFQMALSNRRISTDVETVFLMTAPEYSFLSSSLIKEIARNGGDVSAFVTDHVADRLKERLAR